MAYKLGITRRVSATSHAKEEVVVEGLADIGRAVVEDAPCNWNAAYVVIVETTAAPGTVLKPAVLLGA